MRILATIWVCLGIIALWPKKTFEMPSYEVCYDFQYELCPQVEEVRGEMVVRDPLRGALASLETIVDLTPAKAEFTAAQLMTIHEYVGKDFRDLRRKMYVERFKDIAISEQRKYGIPASITLAQGILESDACGSTLYRHSRNHFGIKYWNGKHLPREIKAGLLDPVNFHDDDKDDMFCAYQSDWYSFRHHSLFLQKKNYRWMIDKYPYYEKGAYKKWAQGLQSRGYATSKTYAKKLTKLIEDMELHQYDVQ